MLVFLFMIVVATYDLKWGALNELLRIYPQHDSVIGNTNPFKIEDIKTTQVRPSLQTSLMDIPAFGTSFFHRPPIQVRTQSIEVLRLPQSCHECWPFWRSLRAWGLLYWWILMICSLDVITFLECGIFPNEEHQNSADWTVKIRNQFFLMMLRVAGSNRSFVVPGFWPTPLLYPFIDAWSPIFLAQISMDVVSAQRMSDQKSFLKGCSGMNLSGLSFQDSTYYFSL